MHRLTLAACAALALGTAPFAPSARADVTEPECIAPAEPGGGFDLTCRVAQAGLKAGFDDPLRVTFMPGGIGAVAYSLFNTSRTDDPNAIVAFSSGSLLNIATGKYGEWTEEDARFLATAGADFGAVIVKGDSEYADLDALMEDFGADPGSVTIGAGGSVGSQDWMKAALLLKSVDADPKAMRYVAYDGGGAAIAGLLGGSIGVYTGDVGEMTPYLESGDLRMLAIMSPERLPEPFADFPTAKELGYDVEWTIMRGFYMGKDVSDEDYRTWADAFDAAYATEEFAAIQKDKGLLPLNVSGEALDARVKTLIGELRDVAKEAGLIR